MSTQIRRAEYHGGIITIEIGPLVTRVQSCVLIGKAEPVDFTFHGFIGNNNAAYTATVQGFVNNACAAIDAFRADKVLWTQRTDEAEAMLDLLE